MPLLNVAGNLKCYQYNHWVLLQVHTVLLTTHMLLLTKTLMLLALPPTLHNRIS